MKLWSVLLQASDSSLATRVIGIWDRAVSARRQALGACEEAAAVVGSDVEVMERADPDGDEWWFDLCRGEETVRAAYVTVERHFLNEATISLDLALMLDAVRGSDKP